MSVKLPLFSQVGRDREIWAWQSAFRLERAAQRDFALEHAQIAHGESGKREAKQAFQNAIVSVAEVSNP